MQFDFARQAGQWFGETVPGANDYALFDIRLSKAINATDGGSWAPSTPIIIGGSGLTLGASSTITGGVTTATGGRVMLGASDLPLLSAPVADTQIVPVLTPRMSVGGVVSGDLFEDDYFALYEAAGALGIQTALATGYLFEIPKRYMHHGATLTKLTLRYRLMTRPSVLPSNLLSFSPFVFDAQAHTQPFKPGVLSKWASSTAYTLGQYVIPNLGTPTGLYYKCTTAGTSSASEPTSATSNAWPTTIGNTITDGTVVWTAQGYSGQTAQATAGGGATAYTLLTPDGYYAAGGSSALAYSFDGATGNAIDSSLRYGILITGANDASSSDPTQNLVIHSLQIDYGGISSIGFQ